MSFVWLDSVLWPACYIWLIYEEFRTPSSKILVRSVRIDVQTITYLETMFVVNTTWSKFKTSWSWTFCGKPSLICFSVFDIGFHKSCQSIMLCELIRNMAKCLKKHMYSFAHLEMKIQFSLQTNLLKSKSRVDTMRFGNIKVTSIWHSMRSEIWEIHKCGFPPVRAGGNSAAAGMTQRLNTAIEGTSKKGWIKGHNSTCF